MPNSCGDSSNRSHIPSIKEAFMKQTKVKRARDVSNDSAEVQPDETPRATPLQAQPIVSATKQQRPSYKIDTIKERMTSPRLYQPATPSQHQNQNMYERAKQML